jgi:hypothetical protein
MIADVSCLGTAAFFMPSGVPSMRKLPHLIPLTMAAILLLTSNGRCRAGRMTYLNEGEYLTALASMGLGTVHEGFENDATWGAVRTTIPSGFNTAPSITSQGIIWTSNNANSEATTSNGAAVTGDWGVFSYPHGDFSGPNPVPDGFAGSSTQTLFGVGGWIRTNTPFAGISLALDGVPVDFGNLPGGGDPTVVGTTPAFWGVIDTDGFNSFLWQETEGTSGDQKLIFADNFTFGVASAAAVPEPSTLTLIAIGGLTLLGWRRLSRTACRSK